MPQVWLYALGALLVLGVGVEGNPDAPVSGVLSAIAGLTAGWLALLLLLVDETKDGFADVYSAAVSTQNLFPRLGQRRLIVGATAVAFVIAWLVPLAGYQSFLLLIGSAFVPLLGVLAADYFLLRGRQYDVAAFYDANGPYWYTGGVNWLGITTWIAGVATYLVISGLPSFGINGLAPALGASLPSFAVAFVLHTVLGRLAMRHPAPAGRPAS